ncbi:coiled-coil domain-containing protein [Acrasis kona]|uniref:Coiled-coil domain-containing protein n=1 Tax=Acrasis kona TaxID=1008807 RepID=A0AAW2ZF89_9EUKA
MSRSNLSEVDSIILVQLKQIGIDLRDNNGKEVTSLAQFDKVLLYRAAVACVKSAGASLQRSFDEIPDEIPGEMSQCFRELGFRQQISFDQFLYPTEKDVRAMLSWLAQQAKPAEDSEAQPEVLDTVHSTDRRVRDALTHLNRTTWTMNPFLKFLKGNPHLPKPGRLVARDLEFARKGTFATDVVQQSAREFASSVLEDNAARLAHSAILDDIYIQEDAMDAASRKEADQKRSAQLMKKVADVLRSTHGAHSSDNTQQHVRMSNLSDLLLPPGASIHSNFVNRIKFETDQSVSTPLQPPASTLNNSESSSVEDNASKQEQKEQERLEEIEKYDSAISKLTDAMHHFETESNRLEQALKSHESDLQLEKTKKTSLESQYKVDGQVESLLQDQNKIREIQNICEKSRQNLIKLGQEWERHRTTFVNRIRQLKLDQADKLASTKDLLARAKRNREDMKKLIVEVKEKEALVQALEQERNNIPQGAEQARSQYIVRIMEIGKSVDKQKFEMNKILLENGQEHSQVVTLTQSLQRTFRETEDLIYKEAQKGDESSKQAYRHLSEMRNLFEGLIQGVNDTGNTLNLIRDLDNNIEDLSHDKAVLSIDQLVQDLNIIRNENQQLIEQLKQFT